MSTPDVSPNSGVQLPPDVVVFGPKANCTLDICPVEYSVYGYRPSLAANISLIALYALAIAVHFYLGLRWKQWWFTGCMLLGAVNAIIGYIGRVMMYYNPFNFGAFMLQIICVTTGPVYYCAAIYITLALTINHLSPSLSRFKPKLFYYIFIPCDLFSLVVQAAGGALSTSTAGQSQTGVDLALVGLSFQVFTIVLFCAFFGDFLLRYFRSGGDHGDESRRRMSSICIDRNEMIKGDMESSPGGGGGGGGEKDGRERKWTNSRLGGGRRLSSTNRLKLYFGFMVVAVLLILARCSYRLAELHGGYTGGMIRDEGLFIGLEGVMILASVYCLMVGHPGLVFKNNQLRRTHAEGF